MFRHYLLDQRGHLVDTAPQIGADAGTFDVGRRLPKLEKVTDDHEVDALVPLFRNLVQKAFERPGPAEILRRMPCPAGALPDTEMQIADEHAMPRQSGWRLVGHLCLRGRLTCVLGVRGDKRTGQDHCGQEDRALKNHAIPVELG